MKRKRTWGAALLIGLAIAIILAGGSLYMDAVQEALWDKSVTDILEVTSQGAHALDTYLEKDAESLHWLAHQLSLTDEADTEAIQATLDQLVLLDGDFLCADLDGGALYVGGGDSGLRLSDAQRETFLAMEGAGVREPYLNDYSGVWTLGYYARFTFAGGGAGCVQRSLPLNEIAERFSLSFYENSGFSYVVGADGDILIRSQHPNSNRTFRNLFDIIDLQGNDEAAVRAFRDSISQGQRGVARFQYQGEDYVFCYVPLTGGEGWSVVSIIPNGVIAEQTNNIAQQSRLFLLLIVISILLLLTFFVVYRSSTRRVLMAEEEARRAAEQASLAKSRFLSNMSHDIRTPMNAIVGMTQLAADHVEEPERVRAYLKNIRQSGQLLLSLINDILDLSKIESGKMVLHNDTASLEALVANLASVLQPTMAAKRQHFEVRLHGIRHELLCFDSLRMNQMLLNLLSNASKFTPEGGVITLDVTESDAGRDGCAHFTFRVADNGIGMQPEFLAHIFDSFAREQDGRVNKIEGSGLGMAITKLIVDMMEGTIAVESTPGQGSTFTVDVDLRLPEALPQELALPPLRVLLADDDPTIRSAAEEFLRSAGVTVDTVADGPAAVERATGAVGYDLILLDWKMPGQDGIETAAALRARLGPTPPIVIVTSYDLNGREAEAERAGVNGFIAKPFFKTTLLRCLRQYVLPGGQPELDRLQVDLSGRRVLLAEDNRLNQLIVQELLEKAGVLVEVVENGQLCVDRFGASAPGELDLILMDIHMPVMNGYEATRRIRAMDRPDAGIPILAITADAFTDDIEMARQAGMDSHLSKPLDIRRMMLELQRFLAP